METQYNTLMQEFQMLQKNVRDNEKANIDDIVAAKVKESLSKLTLSRNDTNLHQVVQLEDKMNKNFEFLIQNHTKEMLHGQKENIRNQIDHLYWELTTWKSNYPTTSDPLRRRCKQLSTIGQLLKQNMNQSEHKPHRY